jgi:hypothetical protein
MKNLNETNKSSARMIKLKLVTLEILPYLKAGHLLEIILGLNSEEIITFLAGTQEHIRKWGWVVTPQGWVNWPDTQKRIYRNDRSIEWKGHQVHGMVEGYKTFAVLPFEEEWSIIHNKSIVRQEKQNKLYETI